MMMQFMMNMLMVIYSFIFFQMKHPLAMGFMLLVQTINICFIMGMLTNSFWFSYILFLVFLGGMLVLFIYVTSLASNEMFNFSFKLMFIILMMMASAFMFSILIDWSIISFINSNEMMTLEMNALNEELFKMIYKLYNFSTNWITCLIINYLLFTLVVVVKITNFFYGPIRNLS